jgi:DNA-binding IclR family transcriptional regulator
MPKSTSAPERGPNQNIGRATLVMSVLAEASAQGLRLVDVARATGLGNATVHRVLTGLVTHGLAESDPETGRFFLGMRLMAWAAMSSERFGLQRWIEPALVRIAQRTADTVYLSARVGDESICISRHEGAFPIKALTLNVGDRRPLGVGTGSLALLAVLPDDEIERVLSAQAQMRQSFAIDEPTLRELVANTRRLGYAFNDLHVFPGLGTIADMSGIALPLRHKDGRPFAAISVVALSSRMTPPRRENIVATLRQEVTQIETMLRGDSAPADTQRRNIANDQV